jgi:hypothetical protein
MNFVLSVVPELVLSRLSTARFTTSMPVGSVGMGGRLSE